jgi:hypothetical protein
MEDPARRAALVERSTALLHGELSMEHTVAQFVNVLASSAT